MSSFRSFIFLLFIGFVYYRMQSCSAVFVGGVTRYSSAHDYSEGVHLYELLG
jgi:hypothetical protein